MVRHLEKICSACIASSSERCVSCRARIPICRECRAFAIVVHFDIGPVPVSWEERPLMFRVASLTLARWPFGVGMFPRSVWSGFVVFRSVRFGGGSPCVAGGSCGSGVPPGSGPCTSSGGSSVGMGSHLPAAGAVGMRPEAGGPGRVKKPV